MKKDTTPNVDAAEIAKFEALASRWWDRAGDFRPLHQMNPLRANYIDARSDVMIRVHPDVARALREAESDVIDEIRHMLKRDVIVKSDPTLHIEHFNIVT